MESVSWGAPTEEDADPAALAAFARQLCTGLLRLAESDEASRLLGVDGTLEDEVDVAFAIDPLGWIGSEIANAARNALEQPAPAEQDDEGDETPSLSLVVALIRLAGILRGGPLTADELTAAVVEYLS